MKQLTVNTSSSIVRTLETLHGVQPSRPASRRDHRLETDEESNMVHDTDETAQQNPFVINEVEQNSTKLFSVHFKGNKYINEREPFLKVIMEEENCSRDEAKTCVIASINGGKFKTTITYDLPKTPPKSL